jgi:hypothetical protein
LILEEEFELAHFFAWARARAYTELERRLAIDPQLDPNWTFSDIMQELLEEFRNQKGTANVDSPM